MIQVYEQIPIETKGQHILDITKFIESFIINKNIKNGLLVINLLHTSASLIIQENADPDVLKDLKFFFNKLVSMEEEYSHSSEGKDDMPAHIKSALTNTSISVSVRDNRLMLGTWQAIYLFEHRLIKKIRTLGLHFIGD